MSPWRNAAQAIEDEIRGGILKTRVADTVLYSAYDDPPIQTTRSLMFISEEASWGEGPRETMCPDASRPRISGFGET